MTDNEIIKALEDFIAKVVRLQDGFLLDGKDSTKLELLLKNALDLINRLQAENEIKDKIYISLLKTSCERADIIGQQYAEIERLKDYNENLQTANAALSEEILETKAEAYKEFAERLCEGRVSNDNTVILAKCLLKELVGEDNV